MARLSEDTIARVKACKGVYSCGDVARHFAISKSTVSDLWNDKRYTHLSPAPEPDNVASSRVSRAVVQEDAPLLLSRGMKPNEVAEHIGISERTLYRHIGRTVVFT